MARLSGSAASVEVGPGTRRVEEGAGTTSQAPPPCTEEARSGVVEVAGPRGGGTEAEVGHPRTTGADGVAAGRVMACGGSKAAAGSWAAAVAGCEWAADGSLAAAAAAEAGCHNCGAAGPAAGSRPCRLPRGVALCHQWGAAARGAWGAAARRPQSWAWRRCCQWWEWAFLPWGVRRVAARTTSTALLV